MGKSRQRSLTRSRPVRGITAVALTLTIASTGIVATAAPAFAAAPAPTILTSPTPSPGNDATPTWTFENLTDTWECSVDVVPNAPTTWSDCSSGTYVSPPLTSDADYVFSVRRVITGGADIASSAPYTFDSTAQATVSVPSPTNDPTPTWAIGLEPDGASPSTATCTLDTVPVGSCTTGFTPGADLAGGSHSLVVDFTDGVGNTGTSTSTVEIDLTRPATPTPSGPAALTNNPAVAWTWSAEAGATASCTLVGPDSTVGPAACSGAGSHSATVADDGLYTLQVSLTDSAGNVGDPGSSAFTFDGTAPDLPVFSVEPASPSTDRNPSWTFTTPGTSTTCSLSSTTHGTVDLGSCQPGTAQGSNLADDSWTLAVTTGDAAGNTRTATSAAYLLDTTGPDAPTVDRPAALGNNANPQFTWSGEIPTTARCREVRTDLPSTVTRGAWSPCDGRFFDLALLVDADYQVEAQLTDPLGNVGQIGVSGTYTYDGTAPAAPVLAGVPLVGADATPTYTFDVEAGGAASCRFSEAGTWTGVTDCGAGGYTPVLPGDGDFVIEVVTRDAAGNSAATTRPYTLDTTAPGSATITSPASPSNEVNPVWGTSGDGSSTLTCRLLGTIPATTATSCPSGYSVSLAGQADGSYTLEVTATDGAGNSTVTTAVHVLDTSAPGSPTVTGPASPGNAFSPTWTFPVQAQTTAQCRLVQGLSVGVWSPCDAGSFVVNDLADGTYTAEVLVTDLAGNAAAVAPSAPYTSDRTAPAAPTVTGPTSPGNDPAPSWTWSGETGVTASCRLDRAGVIGTPVACNTGSFSPTLTGDTTYDVVVRLTDAAGNVSNPTPAPTYTLDTAAPVQPTVTGPTGVGNNANPAWTFTAETGSSVQCGLVRAGVVGPWSGCSSGQSWALPNDAVYALQVWVTDAAGNASAVGSSAPYTYDGTAPAAPVVIAPASPSATVTPAWSFTAESGAAAQCRLLRTGALVVDWAGCTSPVTFTLTGLPDGAYDAEVKATDPAGNTGATGRALPYVLDTTPPDAPTVTGPSGPSTNTTPTFTWTGEAGTTALCRLVHDGVLLASQPCATPYAPVLGPDGQWSLRVRLLDAAGNQSTVPGQSGNYVLDTVAPVAPVVTAPASPGRDTAPSWSAVVESGATTECQLARGATVLLAWNGCTLPVSTDLSGAPDGSYQLSVRATDAAGQTGPAGSGSYLLDTTAPASPLFTSVPTSPSRTKAISFAFTAESGAVLTCRLTSGATVVSPDTTCTSPLPVNLTGLADAAYTLSVRATDAAGNSGPSQTVVYVLDTTAPTAPVLVTGPAPITPDNSPSWTFTAESGATVTCRVTGAKSGVVVGDVPCTSPFVADLRAEKDDTYTLTARATDVAGNTGPALSTGYVLDSSAPSTADVIGPPSPGRDVSPTWQLSSIEGTVQCRLVKGATVLRDWTTCGPTFSVNLAGSGDGLYVLSARVVDAAGNLSAEVTSRYTLDTVAPVPATLTTPASPATNRAPIWTVASSDPGVTALCQVTGPTGTVVRAFAACAVSAAGSPYALDLSGAPDGAWMLVVRLTDTAGNVGPDARGSYVLDSTAPNSVLVVTPASPSSAATPTWQLTGDSDATLECRLTGPGLTGSTFAPCTATPGVPGAGSFSADLTSRPDGTYTLAARSRDAAGNLGPETTSGYEVDRIAPAPPTAPVAPPSPSQVAAITWDFTLEAGSTALCTLSSAAAVVAPEQPCASPWATDLALFGDGDFGLSVRAVDAAGNRSTSVASRYVLDRTAPAAPAIVASPGSPSPDDTPTWSLEPSAVADTLECRLLGLPAPVWGPCGATVTFDLNPAVDGTFRLEVRESDAAQNVSGSTSSADYVLDLTAPATPLVLPPVPQRGNSLAPVFTIDRQPGDVESATFVCSVTRVDLVVSTAAPCDVGNATVDLSQPSLLDGDSDVVLGVRAVDIHGNVSGETKATYRFDNLPPDTPNLHRVSASPSLLATAEWTFDSTDSTYSFECELTRLGATVPVGARTACSSPHVQVGLPTPGEYTFSVWALDAAGNPSLVPATSTYLYLPPVPQITRLRGPTGGATDTPTWTFTVPRPLDHVARCSLSAPGGTSIDPKVCTNGVYRPVLTGAPAGTYTLSIQLTDLFGNPGDVVESSYRYTPVVVQEGHLGQPGPTTTPGRPVPGARPPTPGGAPDVPGGRTPLGGSPTGAGPLHDVRPPSGQVTPGKPVAVAAARPLSVAPALQEVPRIIGKALTDLGRKPTIPLLLLFVVVGFLLLQNRIDRRDPKLASAPMGAEPELDFGPTLGLRSRPGRTVDGGAPA